MKLRGLLIFGALAVAAGCASSSARGGRDRAAADVMRPLLERLASDPDDVDARLALADARLAASDAEGALVEIYKALAVAPTSSRAHVARARVYFVRGLPSLEIEAWRAALAADESNVEIRENLAHALLAAGDRTAAVAQYRAVLERKPHAAAVLYNLALLATEAGDLVEARHLWTRYLEIDPAGDWADKARDALAAIPSGEVQP